MYNTCVAHYFFTWCH